MYISETKIRVRYAETDRMGYAYYGNYATYFEVARVEALRQLGLTYKKLEDDGVILPVIDYSVRFFKPAYYDDLLTIRTTISEMPGVRIHFKYEAFNEEGEKLNEGATTLVFIDKEKNKPCKPPEEFIAKMKNYF